MHRIVKKTLSTYISDRRIVAAEEMDPDLMIYAGLRDLVFITLYKGSQIIASSGRVMIKKSNTLLECIDNSLACLQDPRFAEHIKDPSEVLKLSIRVDTIRSDQRRIVKSPSEIDASKEGIILVSQTKNAISVILPNMTKLVTSGQDLYELACMKAGLNISELADTDTILYAISTTTYRDF